MNQFLIKQMYFTSPEQKVLELLSTQDQTMRGIIENINLYGVNHQGMLARMQKDGWVSMTKYTYSLTDVGRAVLENMQRKAA